MIAILHNIRSLHNVGSIFRTADAAGVEKIYLTGITPSPVDALGLKRRQIAKVSLGAEDYIPWEKKKSITPLLRSFKKQGCKIFAIEQSKKSIPYSRFHIPNSRFALIVGNEIRGLPKSVLNQCDKILEIPMHGRKESLNVAVAFGIAVFHFAKSD